MKKLPFVYPPIIDAYSGVAGNVAVQLNYRSYVPLIIYNHFLVSYNVEEEVAGFNWNYYIDDYGYYFDLWKSIRKVGVQETFNKVISKGYYIDVYLNHYYIKCSDSYKKENFLHDCATIFGFDEMTEEYLVADNFRDGKYSVEKISKKEIEEAVLNNSNEIVEGFKFEKEINFQLDMDTLTRLIKSYLSGKCYLKKHKNTKNIKEVEILGIKIYKIMRQECQEMKNLDYEYCDCRTFQVMLNHMAIGKLMICYIRNKVNVKMLNEIEKSYEEMYEQMLVMRNMFIKAYIRKKERLYDDIIFKLNLISEQEEKVLIKLLAIILTVN